ncbi:secondary thiamine-phosphate synthase enzyme YjbQ [Desulfurobacterium atlanticum]|uniref:Secondary thiamine-phosphate synthase enzyme n=1 Tax=Desulfurobacterium atlanticum TaxID=240169 RepID=A0A238YGF4_9BACT|nr:secondary thiamine-phosphate synthase enzyme YjbQ [Desulfurobacterium atlanticum]SNR70275.1 secondary thiamine-phosphate synthase enzyme [Desulfurobacterium atlanticum]
MIYEITLRTSKRSQFIDISREVQGIVSRSGVEEGICVVYVPHTTAGITINENADPTVRKDIVSYLEKYVPWKEAYFEHIEGNSAAHIKSSLIGCNITVIVKDGRLLLGQWQGIYFCEFDGPRNRRVIVKVLEG